MKKMRVRVLEDTGSRRVGDELELDQDVAESLIRQGSVAEISGVWEHAPMVTISRPASRGVIPWRRRLKLAWQILHGASPEELSSPLEISQHVLRSRVEWTESGPRLDLDLVLDGLPLELEVRTRQEPVSPSNPCYIFDGALRSKDTTRITLEAPTHHGRRFA